MKIKLLNIKSQNFVYRNESTWVRGKNKKKHNVKRENIAKTVIIILWDIKIYVNACVETEIKRMKTWVSRNIKLMKPTTI